LLDGAGGLEGGPGDGVDLVLVAGEGLKHLALALEDLLGAPDKDGLVGARGCEEGARARHSDALDPVRVFLSQRLQTGAAKGVPDFDGLVPGTGNEEVGVRGHECQARDFVLVARQRLLHRECRQVPELNGHVCGARG